MTYTFSALRNNMLSQRTLCVTKIKTELQQSSIRQTPYNKYSNSTAQVTTVTWCYCIHSRQLCGVITFAKEVFWYPQYTVECSESRLLVDISISDHRYKECCQYTGVTVL